MYFLKRITVTLFALLVLICSLPTYADQPPVAPPTPAPTQTTSPAAVPVRQVVPDIAERLKQFPRTVIDYDHSLLDEKETQLVMKLIEASRSMDEIFWRQVSEDNPKLRTELTQDAKGSPNIQMGLEYFDLMKGRWDRLEEEEPFISPFGEAGKKPLGAGFYPTDMTKEEFDSWIKEHPTDAGPFQDVATVIRRQEGKLIAIPYSKYHNDWLTTASSKLKEAAAMTGNASLKDYLTKRADAFLTNNYHDSDVAWVLMDSPIEVVIGPYEVYEDRLFNYKASFESFVTVVDKAESERLKTYTKHLPDMEKNLPILDIHKNPTRGAESSIKVVQEVFTSGDARRGVQTSAFNLPNDEQVRTEKGFKNIIIKNVMEAKYYKTGEPIAKRILDPSQLSLLSFDAFFNAVLFHELSHGLGPGFIKGPDGKKVENRILLKNLYSTIEECKADVLGVWNLLYAMENKWFSTFDANTLLVTYSGLMFRGMRFGIGEAHGRGTAVQWNWFREKGAIMPSEGGRYKVYFEKSREAVRSLSNELLMIEATGDYDRAQRLLDKYGKETPEIESVTAGLKDIPVDIAPVFVAAGEK
jgi:Peptidase family M49